MKVLFPGWDWMAGNRRRLKLKYFPQAPLVFSDYDRIFGILQWQYVKHIPITSTRPPAWFLPLPSPPLQPVKG
jgi:hypothetical protein